MSRDATALRVGGLFAEGVTRYPEGSVYAWDPRQVPSHHRLMVFAERPSAAERAGFGAGARMELALVVDGPALVLLWRADGWPWSDSPYTWHLQRCEGVPSIEPIPEGAGVPLDAWLVDASSGRVSALRRVAMPGAFALDLHRAIVAQAAAPWSEAAYDATLRRLNAEPCEALVARASARCVMGRRS